MGFLKEVLCICYIMSINTQQTKLKKGYMDITAIKIEKKLTDKPPYICSLRPNKKISVFWVTGLKILGRVGTHIFFYFFFSGKKIQFYAF